jgi:hypothetical protein
MNAQKTLKEFLFFRMQNHKRDSVFWMYLIFIVCGIGAAGVWATIVPAIIAWDVLKFNTSNAASAIYTFFPALLVPSCAELLLPDNICKPVRMLSIVLIIIALLMMILCANLHDIASIIVGLIGSILAVLMWVIAHGEDHSLSDGIITSNNSTGGDVAKPVQGAEGEYAL